MFVGHDLEQILINTLVFLLISLDIQHFARHILGTRQMDACCTSEKGVLTLTR